MTRIMIICGPTATGKTKLALALARKFNGELISGDSRQVYKGMDIGTGKDLSGKFPISNLQFPIKYKEKQYDLVTYSIDDIPLWLYDVVNPDEEFSVAPYQRLAKAAIEDIRKRGKLPIIVGGTGLYIKSLIEPMETISIPPNKKLRKELNRLSLVNLQKRVYQQAPSVWDSMNVSDRQNPRRLIRKFEISQQEKNYITSNNTYDYLMIGLRVPFPILYERIDRRVDERVKQGILEEIKGLLAKGYSWDLPAMNALGYKEWKGSFDKQQEVIQRWKFHEHAYARRQMTWFRKMKNIEWFDITGAGHQKEVEDKVQRWYTTEYADKG